MPRRYLAAAALPLFLCVVTIESLAQGLDSTAKADAREMLETAKRAIKTSYYDPTFYGLDLNEHFKAAEAKIDSAASVTQAHAVIAQTLLDFGDSHTFFRPPARSATYDYGFQMALVKDDCYVTAVKPGSDAAAKGLRAGDRVLQVGSFVPSREELWKLRYVYHVLSPREVMRMVVQSPGASPRQIEVAARIKREQRVVEISIDSLFDSGVFELADPFVRATRTQLIGNVSITKLETFDFPPKDVDKILDDMLRNATSLILDLRGNGGGRVDTLEQLAGRLFDRDVKLADRAGRKKMKPIAARKHKHPFTGRLVLLVDAESASAAEILARVIQLEKRGTVIGDRSAGAVMQAQHAGSALAGVDGAVPYGFSVTNADLIMADGKSLEKAGVVPDEVVLPTAEDLASGRDPVLARAATLLGALLDAEAAGKLFPVEWKNDKKGS